MAKQQFTAYIKRCEGNIEDIISLFERYSTPNKDKILELDFSKYCALLNAKYLLFVFYSFSL